MRFSKQEFIDEIENLRKTSLEIDDILNVFDISDGVMMDWLERYQRLFILICGDISDKLFDRIFHYTCIKGESDLEALAGDIYDKIIEENLAKNEKE